MLQTALHYLGTGIWIVLSFMLLILVFVKSICCDTHHKDYEDINPDNEFKVLCVDDTATGNDAAENEVTYKTCFERFLMQFLSGTIKWIGKKSEFNPKEKFLMLLDVKTRRPEDFQRALNKLELTGKTGGKRKGSQMTEENYTGNETNILVVAMHHSEIEQWDNVNRDNMDLNDRSCFPLTKIFYSKPFIDDNEVNQQAKEDIQKFIFAK